MSGKLWVDCGELFLQAIAVDVPNAPEELQDLVITVTPDPVPLSPGTIKVGVANGRPNGQLTLTVIGSVKEPVEINLDESGGATDVSVAIDVPFPDEYVLTAGVVTGGIGSGLIGDGLVGDPTADDTETDDPYPDTGSATFTVLDVDTLGATVVPPLVPPPAVQPTTGVKRWVFQDPVDDETYHFHYNPNAMRSPFAAKAITSTPTTAINGQVLAFESMAAPVDFEFEGFILEQEHYDALLHWKNKRHRVWLTDHFGRAWLVYVRAFDPVPRRDPDRYWSHTYTMNCLIFAGPVTPA